MSRLMPRPRAILFDLDGVLIDSEQVWFRVMNAAALELGHAPIPRERFEATWGQSVEDDVHCFFPTSTVADVEEYYNRHFLDHVEHLIVSDGAPELFPRLRQSGCRSCVITNTPTTLARAVLRRARIDADGVVGSTDVQAAKPAPDMVLRACELLSVGPGESAVLGDSRYDREAARAAGAWFIGYRTEGDLRIERLNQLLDLI